MGLPDTNSSKSSTGSSSTQTTNSKQTGSDTNTGTGTGTDNSSSDPASVQQPSDSGSETGNETTPADTDPAGEDPGNSGEGDVIPPGLDGQGQDIRDTAEDYVGQDMDSLVGEIGTANATEYGTDEATGNTIVYHYYDGFAVSTVEGDDGGQTVTGIW